MLAWLNESDRWRAAVTVVAHEGAGAFLMRTLAGDPPRRAGRRAGRRRGASCCCRSTRPARAGCRGSRACTSTTSRAPARASSTEGLSPAPAELSLEIGDHGEPDITLFTLWDPSLRAGLQAPARGAPDPPARALLRPRRRPGRSPCPADPALAPALSEFIAARPGAAGRRARGRSAGRAARRARARVRDGRALLRRGRRARRTSSWAASCTRSSAPACATRSSAGAPSSPTSRASARPCRRWRRSRPTTPSRRSWCARRA